MVNRVPTTIPGLDELIEGGFIENDVILVVGGPGSGKTTMGVQFLYGGIMEYDEPGVYVTMEETPSRIIRNMWRHGFDLERLIREKKLRVIQAEPVKFAKFLSKPQEVDSVHAEDSTLEELIQSIKEHVDEINARRIFIDGITSLKMLPEPAMIRHTILEFVRNLEYIDCTTLVTSEAKNTSGEEFNVEEYLVEGVIRLHQFRTGGQKVKGIEIVKMRGVNHDETLHPYSIEEGGVVVHPHETVIADVQGGGFEQPSPF